MKRAVLVLVALVSFAFLIAGCSSGGSSKKAKNPFVGTWRIAEVGLNVTFTDKEFTIAIPDFGTFTGPYSYQGEYPDFVATLTVEGETSVVNVHFNDEDQFRACGAAGEGCATFDKL